MLLAVVGLLAACADLEPYEEEHFDAGKGESVWVLCEGNFNSGNASISFYDPATKAVRNGAFQRANDRKLGDTGQSITLHNGVAYVAVENSGIVWSIDAQTMRVKGQLLASDTEHMINPRFVHIVSDMKAYVTDLYAPYITIFNPQTMTPLGSIATEQPNLMGYNSTEQMVQWGDFVFVSCWCYSRNILVIDTRTDRLVDTITLSSWQPKSMTVDAAGGLWVITDGGYATEEASFGENLPHLYRIDAATGSIELDLTLPADDASVGLAMNPACDTLYVLNNDVYRMPISAAHLPTEPFILAPTDSKGTRHKLYGISCDPWTGELYVADAVDYLQAGSIYRYSHKGERLDVFRVGINPNGFAFYRGNTHIEGGESEKKETEAERDARLLVSRVFEYMPAPGHQVNGYSITGDFIHAGASMEEACERVMEHFRCQYMVSLGAQGGYLIAGFDHNVVNRNGTYELCIKGNPFNYQSEPGIIWVSMDENGDGLPNDTWYELAGSEYGTDNETLDYAITYYKPTAPHSDIRWTDNQGGEGIVPYMAAWNTHDSYWQDWVPTETDAQGRACRTYYGSRLRDTHTFIDGVTHEPPFAWGYVDNLGSDYFNGPLGTRGYYKISQAVRSDGTPANLPYINFVKVQTAQTGASPNLGEISTEVYGIWEVE